MARRLNSSLRLNSYDKCLPFIFIDSKNNIYIVDQGNHRIMKWEPGAIQGKKVAGITGEPGVDLNKLKVPTAIAVDSKENMYIVHGSTSGIRIVKYSYLATQGEEVVIPSGVKPLNITIDENDDLYYIGNLNNQFHLYKYDTTSEITTKIDMGYLNSYGFLAGSTIAYYKGYIYYVQNIYGHVARVKVEGGTPEQVWYGDLFTTNHVVYTYSLQVSSSYIYLPDRTDGRKRVIRKKFNLED